MDWITDIEKVQAFAAIGMIRPGDWVKVMDLYKVCISIVSNRTPDGETTETLRVIEGDINMNGIEVEEGAGGTIISRLGTSERLPNLDIPCVCFVRGWYLAAFNILAWKPNGEENPGRQVE